MSRSVWYASSTRPGSGGARPPEDHTATLRASDSERSLTADVLAQNFAEGRLDEIEFDDRLHRAMEAKTRGELTALLTDLPAVPSGSATPATRTRRSRAAAPRPRRALGTEVALGILALGALAWLVSAVVTQQVAAAAFAAIVFLVVLKRHNRWRSRRLWHDHLHDHDLPHGHGPRGPVLPK